MNAFKYEVVVGKNGRIEVPFSDLPEGETIEVIFLMKSSAIELRPNLLTWEELSHSIGMAQNGRESLASLSLLSAIGDRQKLCDAEQLIREGREELVQRSIIF